MWMELETLEGLGLRVVITLDEIPHVQISEVLLRPNR